jgi:hypothetical protein
MLVPCRRRVLTVDPRDHPRGQPHLSSASGIARAGACVYIVADDEHHLARLDGVDPFSSPVALLAVVPGELPHDSAQRKKRKPDVEVLLHLPADVHGGGGLLVLLGSGSRPQRERIFVIALKADGSVAANAVELEASSFYSPLHDLFAERNLEAGYADGMQVHLFQRANKGQALNARITYDAAELGAWLRRPSSSAPQPVDVLPFDIGDHEGVPFGITDAAAGPWPGCVFTAVAEDTADAYSDGTCVASMVGWMDASGHVRATRRLAGAPKVEGVAPGDDGRLWLVTDADDPGRASELLEFEWRPA